MNKSESIFYFFFVDSKEFSVETDKPSALGHFCGRTLIACCSCFPEKN